MEDGIVRNKILKVKLSMKEGGTGEIVWFDNTGWGLIGIKDTYFDSSSVVAILGIVFGGDLYIYCFKGSPYKVAII
jgi:hypothetical protein